MDNLKSMLFGAKPRAVKWLGMGGASKHEDEDDEHHGADKMFVHPEAATQVLQPLGEQPINLISIFGAARQGKSFLMNLLADQQDLFKISNLREPCTQGVDLSGHFVPLPKFSALNGCPAISSADNEKQTLHIGFVDAEGQGDRDISYDSRLVSPVLLSSKAVLFNWKDSLQADRILNLLAVLARAAQGIELADGDNSKVFGHLHIVFRDWSFVDSSPDEVFKDLFTKEKGRSEEVNVRNLARVNLLEAFESISVWLFPAPVANTANLKDKIRFEQLQPAFQEKLRDLRMSLSSQLQHPMRFGGKPLTARLLAQMMPPLVETLNSDQVIMPESIYSSLVRAEAKAAKEECERSIAAYCEAACIEELVSTAELEASLRRDIEYLVAEAVDTMKGTPASVQKEMREALQDFAEKEIRLILQLNNEKITEKVSMEVDMILKNLKEECAIIENEAIPMRNDLLRRRCADFLGMEITRLEVLPIGAQGKKGLDAEIKRVREHATVLFDKLEVLNEKAIQRAGTVINEHVRNGKTRMTRDMHETLDKIFSERSPITVTTLQAGLEEQYRDLIKELNGYMDENPFLTANFLEDVDLHKAHLAEELNRRYYLEIRQILSEVGFAAKEELGKEVALKLDGKLPLPEDSIKRSIDDAVQSVKIIVAKQLQGWTVLKTDVAAKSMELEKLGDVYAYEYLRRNKDLQQDVSERQEQQQYEDQKLLNRLAAEKEEALTQAEKERLMREQESLLAKKKEEQINELKTYVQTSLGERELESKKLQEQLREEAERAEKLRREVEEMRDRTREAERQKAEYEAQAREKALREEEARRHESEKMKRELEEMRLRAAELELERHHLQLKATSEEARKQEESRLLAQSLDEVRRQAAHLEAQKAALELQTREEIYRRQQAEEAARAAANAAALSARAAIEAAAGEVSPLRFQIQTTDNKRKLSQTDVDMEVVQHQDHHSAPRGHRVSTVATSEYKKRKIQQPTPKTTPDKVVKSGKSPLEEARAAAKAEMERRVEERAKSLKAAAKKKK